MQFSEDLVGVDVWHWLWFCGRASLCILWCIEWNRAHVGQKEELRVDDME